MNTILRPTLELSILLPGLLLSYLPMKRHLRFSPARLAALALPFTLALSIGGGLACSFFRIRTLYLLLPLAAAVGVFYLCTLKTSPWKSVCVYLAVCAVFSCFGSIARATHGLLYPGNADLWLSIKAALLWVFLCWFFLLAAWYPATHAAADLVDDEAFAQTWYVFWVLPIIFILLNLAMIPADPNTLLQGRVLQLYMVFGIALLGLLLLFYAMFYLMAASLNRNYQLRQENLMLSMQQSQYENLCNAISETREARHDMRHHFRTLQGLAERRDWDALAGYLAEAQASIPDTVLNLCENTAVDSVACYYAGLCQKYGIPCTFKLGLPRTLPVPESDFCLILHNLLENALEASLRTQTSRRRISVQACPHSEHILLLSVENTYDGKIREKDGVFHSSKRPDTGTGTQSVRRMAERNGGYCRFTCGDGVFRADVMLRETL